MASRKRGLVRRSASVAISWFRPKKTPPSPLEKGRGPLNAPDSSDLVRSLVRGMAILFHVRDQKVKGDPNRNGGS